MPLRTKTSLWIGYCLLLMVLLYLWIGQHPQLLSFTHEGSLLVDPDDEEAFLEAYANLQALYPDLQPASKRDLPGLLPQAVGDHTLSWPQIFDISFSDPEPMMQLPGVLSLITEPSSGEGFTENDLAFSLCLLGMLSLIFKQRWQSDHSTREILLMVGATPGAIVRHYIGSLLLLVSAAAVMVCLVVCLT